MWTGCFVNGAQVPAADRSDSSKRQRHHVGVDVGLGVGRRPLPRLVEEVELGEHRPLVGAHQAVGAHQQLEPDECDGQEESVEGESAGHDGRR